MTILEHILLAVLVTISMASVDVAHARYWSAMEDFRRSGRRWNLRGGLWSIAQWCAGGVAFYVNVKVSMWFLPFEGLGLLIGTLLGSRNSREIARGARSSSE